MPKFRQTASAGIFVLTCCLLLTSCEDKVETLRAELSPLREELDRVKKEVSAVNRELKEAREEIDDHEKKIREFEYLQKTEMRSAQDLHEVQDYHDELIAADNWLEERLKIWKTATRESMIGHNLGTIRLEDATTLQDATIVSLNDTVVILSSGGIERDFLIEKLPITVRENLVHEETIRANFRLGAGAQ